jgi:hypothetical protein
MSEQLSTPAAGALLQISRRSGSTALFASEIGHQQYIHFKVSPARTERSMHRTCYGTIGRPHIEFSMSASQFAEAITSLNVSVGTPCTMRYLDGREFPELSPIDERHRFDSERDELLATSLGAIDEALKAIDALNLPEKAKAPLRSQFHKARRALDDSLPFLAEAYQEHMDGIELRAKTEIAAQVDHVVHQYGMEAISLQSQRSIGGEKSH